MSFAIRRASPAEAARLGAFAADLFREAYEPTHPEPTLSAYLAQCFAPDAVGPRLADPTRAFPVVESSDGEWLAYAELRFGPPDGGGVVLERALPAGRALEIVRFYVAARYHGQGIAQALMRTCEDLGADAGCVILWLQAWQEAAQALRFYRKEGFEVAGTALFPFGDRVDHDYLLVKQLRDGASTRTSV